MGYEIESHESRIVAASYQKSAVCRAFVADYGLEHLFVEAGPSEEAEVLWLMGAAELPDEPRTAFLLAMGIWHGAAQLPFTSLFLCSNRFLEKVATFLLAFTSGPFGIERWLGRAESEESGDANG